LLIASYSLTSQNLTFAPIGVGDANFSNSEIQKYNMLSQYLKYEQARLIQLPDVRLMQQKGKLMFNFPDQLHTPILLEAHRIDESPEGFFGWSARIIKGGSGIAVFGINGNLRAAQLLVNGDYYEITPINSQYQIFRKRRLDLDAQVPTCPDMPKNITLSAPTCDYQPDYNTCPAVIDVLLVFTPEALQEARGNFYRL
jgi:hypothetical protein